MRFPRCLSAACFLELQKAKLATGGATLLLIGIPVLIAGRPGLAQTGSGNHNKKTVGNKETVSAGTISDLPLNGRSTSSLVGLQPGVIKAKTQSHGHGTRGFGTQMEIFGSRPRENNSRLDGISVNDYANGPRGSAIGISLGVDALSRLSVLTTNSDASYGRSSGGEISSSTRAGTHQFHGSISYYLRDSALDARNYFDQRKSPFLRDQFAVAAGGPLPDKTFVFADYEAIRQSKGVTHVATVPSRSARAGNLSTGQIAVDPTVKRYLDAFYPLPNGDLLGAGDTGIYVFSGQRITPGHHFTIRVDHDFSSKNSLDGVYLLDKGSVTEPDPLNTLLNEYTSHQQFLTLNDHYTFSSRATNEARIGVNQVKARTGITHPGANPAAADTSFGILAAHDAPHISVAALTPFGGGLDASNRFDFNWISIQAYDDLSLQVGAHALQIGAALERMRDNISATHNPAGNFSFNSLADFLENRPFSLRVAIGDSSRKQFRQTRVAAYLQDDWRMTHRLSLNAGLRYAMSTVPTEVHDRLSALRTLRSPQPHLSAPLFSNPTLFDFEPRVGIAWNPFRASKTLLNASFGIFDVLPLPYEIQFGELFATPWFQSRSAVNLPQGSFPDQAYRIAAGSSSARAAYFQPHPPRNYVMRWNFTVEHKFSPVLTVTAGYVGSHGVHEIFRVNDANIVLPHLTPEGYQWPSPPGSGTRINPDLGRIDASFWIGSSRYDAFVLQVRRRTSHGLQVGGSYTWGNSTDTSSGSISGNEYHNSISSPLWFAPKLNRGPSDFDITQDLKITGSWQIPNVAHGHKPEKRLLSGWQLAGILEASTGVPFTPGIAGDPLGVNSTDPGLDVPDVLSGTGCNSLVNHGNPLHYVKTQCFAVPNPLTLRGDARRNMLIGPGFINIDSSLIRNNYVRRISRTFNIQFRAEVFNLFNHPNFRAPLRHRYLFDSDGNPLDNAGLIGSTQGSPREMQLALRAIW